jgi:hypothetical protein
MLQKKKSFGATIAIPLIAGLIVSCTGNSNELFVQTSENQSNQVSSSHTLPNNAQVKPSPDENQKLKRLVAIVPEKPTVISSLDEVKIMREAAETRRVEALPLLVKCLAFNYDPDNSNEIRTKEEMIPAIGIIKEYFGESAGETLYKEAIATNHEWLVERISLAARTILSEETREQLNLRFLNDAANPKVRNFAASLANENLQIQFARRSNDASEKIDEKIKQIRENKKPN